MIWLAALTLQPPPPPGIVHVDALGSCVGQGGPVELQRVLFAENRSIDIDQRRLGLERESLWIERIGDPGAGRTRIEVAYLISPRADIDIKLQFAMVEGRLSLYWRETYQYRLYRQGIFTIVGDELIPLCEGEGGIWMSH